MTESTMPAAEAAVAARDDERASYEFAFHVLPTVAEGEVAEVYTGLKSLIEAAGGTLLDEEAPQRFDLAYEIVKYVEGRNRKFASAYFGWIRFTLEPSAMEALTAEIEGNRSLLRYLIIRLTKEEEAHPFRFHESIKERKVRTIEERGEAPASEDESSKATDVSGEAADENDDEETKRSEA